MLIDFTYPNGYTTKYDPSIRVGDLVETYHTGYHKVTKVTERINSTPTIDYVRVDGKKTKRSCDAAYVRKVDINELHQSMIKDADDLRELLIKALG